ncbi:hypothetical protein DPMN_000707 [Dreissena polymorpha]|uniref:Uncharacterized protein n=1 Tax=Dreissena polymorpha TaxID=45954 RepID=A0A9D4RPQ8_DREPO|nr:hypothetical protein DPMN_000707 [Dreissena polymorpha]
MNHCKITIQVSTIQVVQYKQNSRLDEKRKKAMDVHLNFIVNQTEQYSTWLTEGLTNSSNTTPDPSVVGDGNIGECLSQNCIK